MALVDLFEGQKVGKEGLPDTHVRLVGRGWDSAFPTTSVFDERSLPVWLFSLPEIRCDNEGWGQWERKALQGKYKDSHDINKQFRYGNWAVHLNGGPQASEESWAAVSVEVNEMPVRDIESISYDWYAQYAGSSHILDIGPNLVFSAYNPLDHSQRVDFNTYAIDNNLFMDDGLANRPVEAGWYRFIMTDSDATERVYWYGNNTGTHTTAPAQGADGYWSQFVTDAGFRDWVVYRIQISFGYWGATRSTGDIWVDGLKINGYSVEWRPSDAEIVEIDKRDALMFGEPYLQARNNGSANWALSGISPLDQKGTSGWLACLYGGIQSGWDDYARVCVPVNEMHLVDLKTAMWTYYMSAAESFGINMVIWVHDPFNPDNRAEITQLADIATLEKANAWNKHILNPSVDQFYFYGEGTTNTELTAEPPNYYGLDDFIADELFNTWTVYRISFEYGWQTGDAEFNDAWVADIKVNGVTIPLKPDSGGSGRIVRRYVQADAGDVALTIAPKTQFRLLNMDVHISSAPASGELLTITKNCGLGTDNRGDTVIFSEDLFIGTQTSKFVPFGEEYVFTAEDELDVFHTNSEDDDWSIIVTYQTVFA